jgi:threonine/homoserine/homoserine lactone efflux protein
MAAAAFAVGLALASTPGPVQGLLVVEAMRGGVNRGLQAVGAAAVPMVGLITISSFGAAFASPSGVALSILQAGGGLVLLWFAFDAYRSAATELPGGRGVHAVGGRMRLPPWARIAVAVLVFPGTWLFLATIAAPLLSSARATAGPLFAVLVGWLMILGTSLMNVAVVLLASWGRRTASRRTLTVIRRVLAVCLAIVGGAMLAWAIVPLVVGVSSKT